MALFELALHACPFKGTEATAPQLRHGVQRRLRVGIVSSSLTMHGKQSRAPVQLVCSAVAPASEKMEEEKDKGDELKLLGTWRGPFAMRVRLALNFKGLSYEYMEEDLSNKSDLLLRSNPLNKKVPVLIHNGKAICESLAILEYIDEVYAGTGPSFLPDDPYDRTRARFWATYIDNKLVAPWWKMFIGKTEEEKAQGKSQTMAAVEALEGALKECSKGRPFFGGDEVGLVDLVLGGMVAWIQGTRALCGVELCDPARTPLLLAWMERFSRLDAANVVLPDIGRLVEYASVKRAQKTII